MDAMPDLPIPFGYKMAWLAIPASDPAEVMNSLGLDGAERANWLTGYRAAYAGRLFVSPVVRGWVFVVCRELPPLGHPPHEAQWHSLMHSLSKKFGEAQYFATHRVSAFHAWSRFVRGEEQRSFAYADGQTLVDRGSKTPGELKLAYRYFDENAPEAESDEYWNRSNLSYPDEQHVMEVAERWSINPTKLDKLDSAPGSGWVATFKRGQM